MKRAMITALTTMLVPLGAAHAQEPEPPNEVVVPVTEEMGVESSTSTSIDVNMNLTAPAPASSPAPAPSSAPAREPELDPDRAPAPEPDDTIFLHGFRLGYLYIFGLDTPVSEENTQPYGERYGIRSPHSFMLGYELAWRLIGHDWLNMLLIGNIMIAGLEQSRFFPSGNFLLGFEIAEAIQFGVGVSLTPTKDDPAHMIFAAGWTPRVGSFYVPVHFFFVPDIEGHHKLGATVGVNFSG